MGFLDKIKGVLFDKPKEEDKKLEEAMEKGADFSGAMVDNSPICNACSQPIEGKPHIMNVGGRIVYLHKRCWKAFKSGRIPGM